SGRVQVSVSMGLLSEDRKGEGLALGLPVYQNVTLARLGRVVRPSREVREAAALVERLAIKATPTQTTSALSGGNQQKVALARLLHQRADVLLLDEPTRGVDVASKAEILGLLDELAASGKAIVVVSSQLEELVSTCDRVHVMKRGVLGAARPVAEVTARALLEEASSA
ncbi:MAG: sugar ABC transporter ATP-binding protein, partial [Myxococcales bacterium]|nr:sugar ABC transporter ATP-binding protein [Myxococcales bacterium]